MSKIKKIMNQVGEAITVEVFEPELPKGTVIFCHGITGCRKGRTPDDDYFQVLAKKIQDHGYKAVLFDFSGHGDSEGNDYDVTLEKSTDELERVIAAEVDTRLDIKFLAFSYGAAVLGNYLTRHELIAPSSIVLYSPCFFPLESCFLSEKSIFGKDIVASYKSGELEKVGYAIVGAKNFRFGYKMIDACKVFNADIFKRYQDRLLVLTGEQDVILETKFNKDYCEQNKIKMKIIEASHSLFEDLNNVFATTIDHFSFDD